MKRNRDRNKVSKICLLIIFFAREYGGDQYNNLSESEVPEAYQGAAGQDDGRNQRIRETLLE
jgi:hypothetical protein